LAGTVIALAVACVVDLAVEGGVMLALRWGPTAALAAVGAWAVFWSPQIAVHDDGPHLRNILRTWVVPWAAIQRIDTKYSLTLVTPGRKITSFAAPAPGRLTARRAVRSDVDHLPESTYGPGRSVRPGDLPAGPSGQIAIVLRERWEARRDADDLDGPSPTPTAVWHRGIAATLGVLAVAAAAAAALIR
jgi:hypothetical protein